VRVTLLNQFYAPDISPTAQLAASLAALGGLAGLVVPLWLLTTTGAARTTGSCPGPDHGVDLGGP